MSKPSVVVVGAGVAGLSCARELSRVGWHPLVLERGRGVGGRCATRRVEGQPVDHGVAFLHGSDPGFVAEVEAVTGASRIPGWPARVRGEGTPCQPHVFHPREFRSAFREGVSAFPKHLAQGVDVLLGRNVVSVKPEGRDIRVTERDGQSWQARAVVIALAAEQAVALLEPLSDVSADVAAACGLLRMVGSLPCLTVLAGYPADGPGPAWDMAYPEQSQVLQLVSHDSRKRTGRRFVILVGQARSCWSRRRIGEPAEAWAREMVEELGSVVGDWARRPLWLQPHRWKYARVDRGSELIRPLLLRFPNGSMLGLVGELFAPGGGVQAAWVSGLRLARRLTEESRP